MIYKENIVVAKGHIKGYVSEKDVDKTTIPPDSVIDCKNIDFYPDHDRRRPPYDIYKDLSALLPGHTIINFHFKTFYNYEGKSQEVIIIAAKVNASGRIKLFSTYYYCPKDGTYDNYNSHTYGFYENLTELTERIDPDTIIVGGNIGGTDYEYKFPGGGTEYNHYRAFFCVNKDGEVKGMVTESIYNGGYTYFNANEEDEKVFYEYITDITVVNQGYGYKSDNLLELQAPGGRPNATFNIYYKIDLIKRITLESGVLDPDTIYMATNVGSGSSPFKILTDGSGNIMSLVDGGSYLNAPPKNNIGIAREENPDSPGTYVSVSGWCIDRVTVVSTGKYYSGITLTNQGNAVLGLSKQSSYDVKISGLIRFPVLQSNIPFFEGTNSYNQINFIDNDNQSVKMMFGDKCEMLWFGMIQNRKYLGASFTETATFPGAQKTWIEWCNVSDEFKNSTEGTSFTVELRLEVEYVNRLTAYYPKNLYLYRKINGEDETLFDTYIGPPNGKATIRWGRQILSGFAVGIVVNYVTTPEVDFRYKYEILKSDCSSHWDGFWLSKDMYEIEGRKVYLYSRNPKNFSITSANELGISFDIATAQYVVEPAKDSRGYSICIELDGYQTLFIKNILTADKYFISECKINIGNHFDRRLSAFLLFYDEFDTYYEGEVSTHDNSFPLTYQVSGSKIGRLEMGNMLRLDDGSFHWFGDSILIVPSVDPETHISIIKQNAVGLQLQEYLNEYYYSKHITMATNADIINNVIVLYGIFKPQDETETILDNGSIAIASYQGAGNICNSIFSVERRKTIARESIIGIRGLASGDFMAFTDKKAYWYNLPDISTGLLQDIGNFETCGALSDRSIVSAVAVENAPIGTASRQFGARQFKGLYWVNSNTIYGFEGNQPVNLLENRWQKEYNTYTDGQKSNIKAGYNPEKDEIWFMVEKRDGFDIFIYKIFYKHWKKYSIDTADKPVKFYFGQDKRMMWANSSTIFKMEKDNTTKTIDKQSATGVPIKFFIDKFLCHSSPLTWKIPDGFTIAYDITATTNQTVAVTVVIKDHVDNEVLNKTYTLTGRSNLQIEQVIPKRVHAKYYRFKMSDDNATQSNIIDLRINAVLNKALLTTGKVKENT